MFKRLCAARRSSSALLLAPPILLALHKLVSFYPFGSWSWSASLSPPAFGDSPFFLRHHLKFSWTFASCRGMTLPFLDLVETSAPFWGAVWRVCRFMAHTALYYCDVCGWQSLQPVYSSKINNHATALLFFFPSHSFRAKIMLEILLMVFG